MNHGEEQGVAVAGTARVEVEWRKVSVCGGRYGVQVGWHLGKPPEENATLWSTEAIWPIRLLQLPRQSTPLYALSTTVRGIAIPQHQHTKRKQSSRAEYWNSAWVTAGV